MVTPYRVQGMGRRQLRLAGAAALALACVVLYLPALGFGFIEFDDDVYLTANPALRYGLSWEGLRFAFETRLGSLWMPVTWLSFLLDYELFGLAPRGYHAVNVVLHAANAALLFVAFDLMTRRPGRSLLVAALFALHPLRVESVAWVAERKDVLSGFFWMLAMIAHARLAARATPARHLALAAAGLASLLAKPMSVTLPFALLLLDVWPLRRLPLAADAASARALVRCVAEKLPLAALSLVVAALAMGATSGLREAAAAVELPLGARVANALVSYVSYLRLAVWPTDLAVLYPHPGLAISAAAAAASAAVLVAVSLAVWLGRERRPWLLTGWLWYLATLVPVIGIVQIGEQAMADRFTYVPLIGIAIAAAWSLPRGRAAAALAAAVCLAFAVASARQLRLWRDTTVLFEHAIRVTGDNPAAEYHLGRLRMKKGDAEGAIVHLERALREMPHASEARTNLALALEAAGRRDEAIEQYREAIRRDPGAVDAQALLGHALLAARRPDEARAAFEAALAAAPDSWMARVGFGELLLRDARQAEALARFLEALGLERGWPENPLGRLAATRAIWILATSADDSLRDPPRGAAIAAHALSARAAALDPELLDAAAAAFAAKGDFGTAISLGERGARVAAAMGRPGLADAIRSRTTGYRSGSPYRQPLR